MIFEWRQKHLEKGEDPFFFFDVLCHIVPK
jgi:hypothetical protein